MITSDAALGARGTLSMAVAAVLLAAALPAGLAQAQQNTGAAVGAESGLDEVVVTARRRAEQLTEVPAAVTAFTASDLESIGVDQPADFLSLTPGVFYRANTTSGTSFINIRGVTQSRNAESPVAVVVDGVFLNNPLAFQNQLVDIQQIEVLKGPQGALYGRNASAGAIIITTKAPSEEYEGMLSMGIGRHQTYKAEGAFGGPLVGDKLLFRVSAYARGTDGFLKNQFLSSGGANGTDVYGDKQDDTGGRVRLLWRMSENLNSDIVLSASRTKGPFNLTIFDPTNSGDDAILDQIPFEPNSRGFNNRRTYDASWKLSWQNALGELTSITSYNQLEEAAGGDSLPYSRSTADGTQWLINEYDTVSQELRLTSPNTDRLRWIAGAYFQHTDRFFGSSSGTDTGSGIVLIDRTGETSRAGSVNPASGGILGTDISQDAWAVFGSLAFDLTEKLELSGALRYDRDEETAKNTGPYGPGFAPNPFRGNTRDLEFAKWQPKVTLRYKLGDAGNVYATYAEGFKNGGFNPEGSRQTALINDPNTPIRDDFAAETTKTFEIGYKNQFFDRRLTTNLAAFFNRIEGANYFDFLVASATQMNLNIDKVEAYGLEAEVVGRITPALTLAASISTLDNTIEEYAFDPRAVGKTSPYFPNFSANVALQWEDRIADNWRGVARIDYEHVGRLYWDLREQVKRPALDFVDARLGVIYGEENPWRAEIYCKNCTNVRYINETVFLSQLGLSVQFPSIDTRLFGLEFTKHF